MTVKELIEKLKEISDQNLPVVIYDDEYMSYYNVTGTKEERIYDPSKKEHETVLVIGDHSDIRII